MSDEVRPDEKTPEKIEAQKREEKRLAEENAKLEELKLKRAEEARIEGVRRQRADGIVERLMAEIGWDVELAKRVRWLVDNEVDSMQIHPPDDEWNLCVALRGAVTSDPKTGRMSFASVGAVCEFYQLMRTGGDDGVRKAAAIFTRCMGDAFDRGLLATLVHELAWAHHHEISTRASIRESDVNFCGRFFWMLLAGELGTDFKRPNVPLNRGIIRRGRTKRLVECIEDLGDMRVNVGKGRMEQQPVEVLRGILFPASAQHDRARLFWWLAARSPSFPVRAFFEPSRPDDEGARTIFTLQLQRSFGQFFTHAPPSAFGKFGRAMADGLRKKWSRREKAESERWDPTVVEELTGATESEREATLRGVVNTVNDPQRQVALADIFRIK